jgi:hypothetical protein
MDNLEKTEGAIKNGQSGENRRGNQEWTIWRKRQHWVHKTKTNKTKTLLNIPHLLYNRSEWCRHRKKRLFYLEIAEYKNYPG